MREIIRNRHDLKRVADDNNFTNIFMNFVEIK